MLLCLRITVMQGLELTEGWVGGQGSDKAS